MNWCAVLTVHVFFAFISAFIAVLCNPFFRNRALKYTAIGLFIYGVVAASILAGLS